MWKKRIGGERKGKEKSFHSFSPLVIVASFSALSPDNLWQYRNVFHQISYENSKLTRQWAVVDVRNCEYKFLNFDSPYLDRRYEFSRIVSCWHVNEIVGRTAEHMHEWMNWLSEISLNAKLKFVNNTTE